MEDPLISDPSITIEIQETSISSISSSSSSSRQILIRLTVVLAVAAACILANHLAFDSFEISISNSSLNTPLGRRFKLMFVSNGKISQILYHSNKLIEQVLYPKDAFSKKPLDHVSIHLSSDNVSAHLSVQPGVKDGEFTIILNPSLMLSENPDKALKIVLHRAMAHVRIWNGPDEAVSAIVEYLVMQVSLEEITVRTGGYGSCWSREFLKYNARKENGFVAKLNSRIRDRYDLGTAYLRLCVDYKAWLTNQTISPSPSTSDLEVI